MVLSLIKHCINRYGIEEVESWYFEIGFEEKLQCNKLKIEDYFKLYEKVVLEIKNISENIKVGGISITSQTILDSYYLEEFLKYCNLNSVPLDFYLFANFL